MIKRWLKRLRRNRLARLARQHKALCRRKGWWYCVECGAVDELESDHILSKHAHRDLMYKIWNLCLRCKKCNLRKSNKFYWEFRTFKVILRASVQSAVFRAVISSAVVASLHLLAVYDLLPIGVLTVLAAFLPPEILYL